MNWLWLSAIVVVLDQFTKELAQRTLVLHDPVSVLPFFNLRLMHNTGAAFSILNGAGGWQRWLFIALALTISTVLVVWIRAVGRQNVWLALALSLVLGGALGNVWDRIILGYVVDFIDVYYAGWHWPTFNVADSAICVGAALLIIDSFRSGKQATPAD